MTTDLIEPGHSSWQSMVTASKVAAVLGVSPYESPRSLWHSMRGELPPVKQTAAMSRGLHLEEGILRWFYSDSPHLERLGKRTVTLGDWAAATPDCVARDTATGEEFPVDAKTDARGLFGEPGTDEVPLHYVTQAMFAMHLGGWQRFTFVVLNSYLERAEYHVTYDRALGDEIEALCREFYDSLSGDVPPNVDGTAATYEALRSIAPIGEGDWECPPDLAHDLCRSRADIAAAEARYNLARSRCLDLMGDAKRVVAGGQLLGQKQRTKGGCALYPPRKDVDLAALPPIADAPATLEGDTAA